MPTVIITLGDPSGIGPEITFKALKKTPSLFKICKPLIVGRRKELEVFSYFGGQIDTFEIPFGNGLKIKPGKIQKDAGRIALVTLAAAVELLREYGPRSALVTAPVCKEAIMESTPGFRGHTEYLAQAFGLNPDNAAMIIVSKKVNALLLTRHIPLKDVPLNLTTGLIKKQVETAVKTLKPRNILFCNLNPHCGEGGRIGREEISVLSAVISDFRKQGQNILGPMAAEKAFAVCSKDDLVACNYHDQAMAPLKLIYGMELVNLTCGLPYARTSPAHGTAFDIAGKNMADSASMFEAIKLAAKLSSRV